LHQYDPHTPFEKAALPHLGAAYRLARWLTGSDREAERVVQEAYVRASRSFGRSGSAGRAWLLAVVRNTCHAWLRRHRPHEAAPSGGKQPNKACGVMRAALEELPAGDREVLVLREQEGCSYAEIAAIAGIPVEAVGSRLGQARDGLRRLLAGRLGGESAG
jgi:RNA polymerase sigma-70 factor (ECF subfamily)